MLPPDVTQAPRDEALLRDLGLVVIQRDWLSANHAVFTQTDAAPATVVDTGYGRHAAMSLALIDHALSESPLQRVINTHLHSDHCGGNHALQSRDPTVQVWVPSASHAAASTWDESALSYRATGQACQRFRVDRALSGGETLPLGHAHWQVHVAPGHDPDAIMLFEPQTRTLIAGDALWEDRLAIIFPELDSRDGFGPTRRTLDCIEALGPRTVIPGHGAVFHDVASALASSRRRLDTFGKDPVRHVKHAARALLMFHLMEVQAVPHSALLYWLISTPLFLTMANRLGKGDEPVSWAKELIDGLLDDGLLSLHDGTLSLSASASR